MEAIHYQWLLLMGSSLLLFIYSPLAKNADQFFRAGNRHGQPPGAFLLMGSLVISWIFAKSIVNAADLGAAFGLVGGLAYSGYYLSFAVAGLVLYRMRTVGGFLSLHHFLQEKFGHSAVVLFSWLVGIRLFNEVWSNTMVIGSYFGETGSMGYYAAIIVFTLLTLAYTWKGGLQSSLFTDLLQFLLFGVLLMAILLMLLPTYKPGIGGWLSSGEWSLAQGGNLLLAAALQSLSYPFHDAVLTDRAFISPANSMRKAFLIATPVGILCIVLFSFVGVYAQDAGLAGSAPVAVARHFGMGMMLCMNFMMVTSAASTLDSAFSSFAKLTTVDLGKDSSLKKGRWSMAALAILGTIPVFLNPEILSATTVSGTMVVGLAPVMVFWYLPVRKIAFHLSVGFGLLMGFILAFGLWPLEWSFPGKYGDLLAVNLIALAGCLGLFLLASKRMRQ